MEQPTFHHDDATLAKVSAKLSEFFGRKVELYHDRSTGHKEIFYKDRHETVPFDTGTFLDSLIDEYQITVKSWFAYDGPDMTVASLSRCFYVWFTFTRATGGGNSFTFELLQDADDPDQFTFRFDR